MLVKIESIKCKEAIELIEELSDELEKLTGNSGKGSFNEEDMESILTDLKLFVCQNN